MIEHPAKRARTEAHNNIQKQADKMVARSTRSLLGLALGDNVAVPVSQFDRSKGDPPNLIGVVLRGNPNGYTIGTRAGIIRGTLARNQIKLYQLNTTQFVNWSENQVYVEAKDMSDDTAVPIA